jgi:hypothetical protein
MIVAGGQGGGGDLAADAASSALNRATQRERSDAIEAWMETRKMRAERSQRSREKRAAMGACCMRAC